MRRRSVPASAVERSTRQKSQIAIPGSKSASTALCLYSPQLGALLAEIRLRRGEEASSVPILRVGGCRGALVGACKTLGLKPLNHHDLRHAFATRCIESGVDIPTVS
jgi:integrase